MSQDPEQEARIMSELEKCFETWWNDEGSAPLVLPMDEEEHTRHISRLAWHNGAYVARSVSPSESYASDGEREAFARWLDGRGAMADLGVRDSYFRAAALLRQPAPAPGPTIDDIWGMCEDHEFHLGMDGANEEESAEGLLEIINTALGRWGRPAPVQGWQPIDTAPKDGTEVQASDYDVVDIVSWDCEPWGEAPAWRNREGQEMFPSWWQPLPDHPPIPQPPQANTTHPIPTENNGTD